MVDIHRRSKALSVSPLKASQTVGAALCFLGFERAIPMLHGSQGCTAFGKVFFVRHFREPIPLQTTAMDQISAVMGPEDNVVEGLRTLCEKHQPGLIGLPTTALAETQGSDVKGAVRVFRQRYPQFDAVPVVALSAPDFSGCLESGFASATAAVIEQLVPLAEQAGTRPGRRRRQVNLLVGAALTPGDVEELKAMVEAFGLRPVVVPDLSDSLDGHLVDSRFSPLTIGGTPVQELATLGDAVATLVVGASMYGAADLLARRTGVPDRRFDHLLGLDAVDRLVDALHQLSGAEVPERLERQRAQLQDAMLDSHFALGLSRFALAGDPDLVVGLSDFLAGLGASTVAAVVSAHAPVLARASCAEIQVGDFQDLERLARANGAEFLIANSHGVESARRLGVPLQRAGFPQYDRLGGYQQTWIGYRGARERLFDLANGLLSLERGEIHPYRARLSPKSDIERPVTGGEPSRHEHAASTAGR